MSQDKPDSTEATVKCPSPTWVHESLMSEYMGMVQDPSVSTKLDNKGTYGWDWYTLQTKDGKKLEVDVQGGDSPLQMEDVLVLGRKEDQGRVVDYFKNGRREKAEFFAGDKDAEIGRGVAKLTGDGDKAFVSEMSGGLNDSKGHNVLFDSAFDSSGNMTKFRTVKENGSDYTPATCEK